MRDSTNERTKAAADVSVSKEEEESEVRGRSHDEHHSGRPPS